MPLHQTTTVAITAGAATLHGDLTRPGTARAIVLFAHGSGSSRLSPRNRRVAALLQEVRLATLLIDLLTPYEEQVDAGTGQYRFDIPFLSERLLAAVDFLQASVAAAGLPIGCFGASTGAAAALLAAAARPADIRAVVSRGGRPDLAARHLGAVQAPTLLIVGGDDPDVLRHNQMALDLLTAHKSLSVIPGASHLFEEPGALDDVARLAAEWFARYLLPEPGGTSRDG